MSLLDRVDEATAHRLDDLVELRIGHECFGRARPDVAARLALAAGVFEAWGDGLRLHAALATAAARTQALAPLLQDLRRDGLLAGWWDERVPVRPRWDRPDWFECERGAQDPLGLPSYGVHLNAYLKVGRETRLWVARRARDRRTWPGRVDHLAAGGQPAGISRDDNMRKEAHEEAGLTDALLTRMRRATALSYRLRTVEGLSDDTIFVYDLELSPGFTPVNQDGEVEAFELWSIPQVCERLQDTQEFKPNVALVVIDFLLRHGLLPAAHPEHQALVQALRPLRGRFDPGD